MQTKKASPLRRLALILVRLARIYVDSPILAGVATFIFVALCIFTGAFLPVFTYVSAMYLVHYRRRYKTYYDLYYAYNACSDTKQYHGKICEAAGWGIVASAVTSVASVLLLITYYEDAGLHGENWLLYTPLLLIALYDWLIALPETPRDSIVERARTFLNDADEKLNSSQGD